jgi:hypothetical protein
LKKIGLISTEDVMNLWISNFYLEMYVGGNVYLPTYISLSVTWFRNCKLTYFIENRFFSNFRFLLILTRSFQS